MAFSSLLDIQYIVLFISTILITQVNNNKRIKGQQSPGIMVAYPNNIKTTKPEKKKKKKS
jgi:hypothetical protein